MAAWIGEDYDTDSDFGGSAARQGDMGLMTLIAGALLGLLGALPGLALARMARRGARVPVAAGLGATVLSATVLTAVLGWAYGAATTRFAAFASVMVTVFLGAWVVEAYKAWRWMSHWR